MLRLPINYVIVLCALQMIKKFSEVWHLQQNVSLCISKSASTEHFIVETRMNNTRNLESRWPITMKYICQVVAEDSIWRCACRVTLVIAFVVQFEHFHGLMFWCLTRGWTTLIHPNWWLSSIAVTILYGRSYEKIALRSGWFKKKKKKL